MSPKRVITMITAKAAAMAVTVPNMDQSSVRCGVSVNNRLKNLKSLYAHSYMYILAF